MYILNAVKFEMQKLLVKMFYTEEKLHLHCAGSNPPEASAPEHLVLLSVFVSVHLIDIIVPHFHWSPFIYVLLSLRCSNNV